MLTAGTSAGAQAPIDDNSRRRWEEMLSSLAQLLPALSRCVAIDGPAEQAGLFASGLTEQLAARGQRIQVTLDVDGSRDVAIFLRTAPGGRHFPVYRRDGEDGKVGGGRERDHDGDRFFAVAERR